MQNSVEAGDSFQFWFVVHSFGRDLDAEVLFGDNNVDLFDLIIGTYFRIDIGVFFNF